ncbi:MAG: AAA family ATPase [Shewanella sp.]|nr:AAA family ATPase [Shewanella sp.]
MTSTKIPATSLTPVFQISKPVDSTPATPLLGQERLTSALKMAELTGQHLYIADFTGLSRLILLGSVQHVSSQKSWQYLTGNISRQNLFGKRLPDGQWQAGALASKQFLMICAESLIKRENLWELLCHCLEHGTYQSGGQSFELQAQIVLIGNSELYAGLRYQESRFSQLFPLLAEIAHELDVNHHSADEYAAYLSCLAATMEFELTACALPTLCRYSSSLTEHQKRLSLASLELVQLLAQARSFTPDNQLDSHAVEQAIAARQFRHNASELFSAQSFDDAFINLPTSGKVIGQINGLTVIDTVDFCYGEPARITTSVHYGDGEVADIERKSELGGNIHAKGMMILTACLYRIFGRDAPLHLNANIVFEQSYQEIDGDSASLAEYCCLISAIAEQPIQQSLAVTGALDQLGNVQAIGGVNEKIEGFFNLCERRGLTGDQGVILPRANLQQLNLPTRIVDAVAAGEFHLYQVAHMDEAVELLMNMPAGEADEDNDFPDDSLYGLVQQRLDKLAGNGAEQPSLLEKIKAKIGFSS